MAGKILIVDDDRDITQIIQLLLEGEGYDTAVAGSGEEALERLDGTVELVILDIMMEGLNGFDTCRLIRQSSYAPILFLSAMSGETEKVAALIAGGDDYLCKPFSAAHRAREGAAGAGHGQRGHCQRSDRQAVLHGV